jgi:hypothetical protein
LGLAHGGEASSHAIEMVMGGGKIILIVSKALFDAAK